MLLYVLRLYDCYLRLDVAKFCFLGLWLDALLITPEGFFVMIVT